MVLAIGLALSIVLCLVSLAPVRASGPLAIVFAWVALPGVIVARQLFSAQRRPWLSAFLVGPIWGFAITSVVLMALWLGGVRSLVVLALAPLVAALLAIPARRLAGAVEWAPLGRRDFAPLLLTLALVPLVNGRPFSRVGEMRPEGRAYRAYFIADFEWAMAVVSEISKGDVPPHNPFLSGDRMHYYWLADLLSGIEHRATRRSVSIEAVTLINQFLLGLAFVGFFYFFVRQYVDSPPAAAFGCMAAVLFTSFEGAQQLYVFWQRGIPWGVLRTLNIDAISNWTFGALKVDGLHRLLLYQSQHATAWALSLSAIVVVTRSRDNGQARVNALAGVCLALGVLISSFIAVLVGSVVALYQFLALVRQQRWRAMILGGIAAGVPVGIAVWIAGQLQYADRSGGPIVYVGNLNPVAAHNALLGIFLSFGPMLIGAAIGAWLAVRERAGRLTIFGLATVVAFFFYFFVDVVDHQHAYVGWRAGHLLFMSFAPLVAYAWQQTWMAGRARVAAAIVAAALVLTAAPMTAIDLYNTQDTDNQMQGPGFKWTEIVSPDELQALDWIKTATPADALVQPDPVRDNESGTWAYMPAFGERRMTAGMPISMIPLQKYREASARVRRAFTAANARDAFDEASASHLQYIYIGPEEQRAYPKIRATLDSAPHLFAPVFRNASVSIYRVAGASSAP